MQKLTYLNVETAQSFAYSVLDDTGIVLNMQMNLQNSMARWAARNNNQLGGALIKRYHILFCCTSLPLASRAPLRVHVSQADGRLL